MEVSFISRIALKTFSSVLEKILIVPKLNMPCTLTHEKWLGKSVSSDFLMKGWVKPFQRVSTQRTTMYQWQRSLCFFGVRSIRCWKGGELGGLPRNKFLPKKHRRHFSLPGGCHRTARVQISGKASEFDLFDPKK